MNPYEDLLRDVFVNGTEKGDRTGTGTRSVFGRQIRYDLSVGFPLITSKRVPFRLVAEELLWFLSGNSNIRPLLEKDVHIWSEWPFEAYLRKTGQSGLKSGTPEWKEELRSFESLVLDNEAFADLHGDLGPVYGVQWRKWMTSDGQTIDQVANAVETIKNNPDSRRIIVTAWNPGELKDMALEPCHAIFQFYVAKGRLSCQLYQRSADMFLGVPFNIASYSLLIHMMAQQCDLEVGDFIWTGGDTHIYSNHLEQVQVQLSREPRPLPELVIKRKPETIFDYKIEDFEIVGYNPHPAIKGEVAV